MRIAPTFLVDSITPWLQPGGVEGFLFRGFSPLFLYKSLTVANQARLHFLGDLSGSLFTIAQGLVEMTVVVMGMGKK